MHKKWKLSSLKKQPFVQFKILYIGNLGWALLTGSYILSGFTCGIFSQLLGFLGADCSRMFSLVYLCYMLQYSPVLIADKGFQSWSKTLNGLLKPALETCTLFFCLLLAKASCKARFKSMGNRLCLLMRYATNSHYTEHGTSKEQRTVTIFAVYNVFPPNKHWVQTVIQGSCITPKETSLVLYKLFQRRKEMKTLPISFYEDRVTSICKLDKNCTRNYTS